ncbi:hypothetical protein LTR04_003103, partial [Oleoguttula sp. CCFEE 6159]
EATTKRIKRNSDHDQPPVASSIEDTHPAPAPDAHALSLALQSPTPGQHVFPASQSPQFHHYVPNTAAQQNSTYVTPYPTFPLPHPSLQQPGNPQYISPWGTPQLQQYQTPYQTPYRAPYQTPYHNRGLYNPIPAPSSRGPQDLTTAVQELVEYQATGLAESTDEGGRGAEELYLDDASQHLKIQSLPILDNLDMKASQIISTLGKRSFQETLDIVTQPETESGQAYATLKSLFDHTKRVYSRDKAFLDSNVVNYASQAQKDIIRKANLATFVSSVFGSQDVGFYHLNEHFLETFVPPGGKLLKWQGALFLDLKTQAYISALLAGDCSRDEIVDDLFPTDLGDRIRARRPDASTQQLAPSEQDFVERAASRRLYLLAEPTTSEALELLPKKYDWTEFLKEVSTSVSKNLVDAVVSDRNIKPPVPQLDSSQYGAYAMHPPPPPTNPHDENIRQNILQTHAAIHGDIRIAQSKRNRAFHQTTPQNFESPYRHSPSDPRRAPLFDDEFVPYMQSEPTRHLYEKARQAVTFKASPANRRAGVPNQRRSWTTEEESALMAGLDRVKGPHWSQILALYGAGGSVSEVLKDRNQVQLKDKARNLKLFFLKSGIEVPFYLQSVTGELKTRVASRSLKSATASRSESLALGATQQLADEDLGIDAGAVMDEEAVSADAQALAQTQTFMSQPAEEGLAQVLTNAMPETNAHNVVRTYDVPDQQLQREITQHAAAANDLVVALADQQQQQQQTSVGQNEDESAAPKLRRSYRRSKGA